MRKNVTMVCLVLVFAMITACSSNGASNAPGNDAQPAGASAASETSDETIVLRVGHPGAEGNAYNVAAKGWGDELNQMTNGKFKLEVYPSSVLGNDRSMIEQVQLGTLEMVITSSASFEPFVPEVGALDLPFLFASREHAYRALDGETGELLNGFIEGAGMKNLGWYENGMRNISTSGVAVRTPEDMTGLKMRAQTSDMFLRLYKTLGADPTAIDYAELYTSLQQGVVDGIDLPWAPFGDAKLYEVINYVAEIPIGYGPAMFVINKDLFASFEPEVQDIMLELGKKWSQEEREFVKELEDKHRKEAIDHGVTVVGVEEVDLEEWKLKMQEVYEQYGQFSEIVDSARKFE